MKNSTNTVLIAILIVVLGIAGYYFFMNSGGPSATALSADGAPSSTAEQTFINLAAELDPISFPTTIFADPRFMNLDDTRTSLTPENAGRPDPFAPLPGTAAQ